MRRALIKILGSAFALLDERSEKLKTVFTKKKHNTKNSMQLPPHFQMLGKNYFLFQ